MKYLIIILLLSVFSCDVEKQEMDDNLKAMAEGWYAKDTATNLCYYVQDGYMGTISMTCVPCDSIQGKVTYHLFNSNSPR
jgi:hypothetical protein